MESTQILKIPISVKNSFIWMDKPFSKGQALIDLYLLSATDNRVLTGNTQIENAGRGQIITSKRRLAIRWGWSKNKTLDFLDLLESLSIITQKSDTRKTIISIVGDISDLDEGYTV